MNEGYIPGHELPTTYEDSPDERDPNSYRWWDANSWESRFRHNDPRFGALTELQRRVPWLGGNQEEESSGWWNKKLGPVGGIFGGGLPMKGLFGGLLGSLFK